MIIIVLAMVAFAVDLGYIAVARTEMQRTADAAAHAAVLEFALTWDAKEARDRAYELSSDFSAVNPVLGRTAAVAAGTDVHVGRYVFGSGQTDLKHGNPDTYNAVKVRIRRTEEQNGAVPTFFAHVLRHAGQEVQAEATAALIRNVSGFKIPRSGEHAPLLPVTLSLAAWNHDMRDASESDEWAYDPITDKVSKGSDGCSEIILFPKDTGSSGNLGTLNIGISNNSTGHLAQQIRRGLSQSDMDYHGGTLELDRSGKLELSGNPGLSASLQKDFKKIVGQKRAVPLYRSVQGNGNNAVFQIVKFVAVRVMDAQLSGKDKWIAVQPTSLVFDGVIQGTSAKASDGIYSPPRLVN